MASRSNSLRGFLAAFRTTRDADRGSAPSALSSRWLIAVRGMLIEIATPLTL
jgi:hypothetical protein